MVKIVKKIVLTGGPCAGKSSSIELIKDYLSNKGFNVLIVQESATELINSGIKPFGENKLSMIEFQDVILRYQLEKEEIILNVAKNISNKDTVIIYDRGVIDNKAYIGQDEFDKLINKYNLNEIDLLNRYDLVIHLETAAKSKFYTNENNKARSEDKDQALIMDKKTYTSWKNHRNLKRVKCYDDFNEKQKEIIKIIGNEFYKNMRVQNKYLISLDNIVIDEEVFYIKQYYLDIDREKVKDKYFIEYRLREVKYKNKLSYYYTIQNKLLNGKSIILKDDNITYDEFIKLLNKNNILNEINKIRKYIVYNDKQYNIDIYENGQVVLEGSNKIEDNYLKILENVTGKEEYLNKNIVIDNRKLVKKHF